MNIFSKAVLDIVLDRQTEMGIEKIVLVRELPYQPRRWGHAPLLWSISGSQVDTISDGVDLVVLIVKEYIIQATQI